MWPNWAIFERSWKQIFLQKLLKYLTTIFGLLLKMLLLKNAANILGQLFGVNIGLLFSLTSGHTGWLIPDTRINTFWTVLNHVYLIPSCCKKLAKMWRLKKGRQIFSPWRSLAKGDEESAQLVSCCIYKIPKHKIQSMKDVTLICLTIVITRFIISFY